MLAQRTLREVVLRPAQQACKDLTIVRGEGKEQRVALPL